MYYRNRRKQPEPALPSPSDPSTPQSARLFSREWPSCCKSRWTFFSSAIILWLQHHRRGRWCCCRTQPCVQPLFLFTLTRNSWPRQLRRSLLLRRSPWWIRRRRKWWQLRLDKSVLAEYRSAKELSTWICGITFSIHIKVKENIPVSFLFLLVYTLLTSVTLNSVVWQPVIIIYLFILQWRSWRDLWSYPNSIFRQGGGRRKRSLRLKKTAKWRQ